jgi:hypothetical protein
MSSVPTVLVARQADGSFAVKVRGGKSETSHVVTVPTGFHERLGVADVPGEELVRASLVFLLDREPASSVLPKFSLDVVARYFPEYLTELRNYLAPRAEHG